MAKIEYRFTSTHQYVWKFLLTCQADHLLPPLPALPSLFAVDRR
jgi:hypothetical protein